MVEEAGLIRAGIAVAFGLVLIAVAGWAIRAGIEARIGVAYDEGFAAANWAVIEKCRVQ
jgi:hypothetical protein